MIPRLHLDPESIELVVFFLKCKARMSFYTCLYTHIWIHWTPNEEQDFKRNITNLLYKGKYYIMQ